MNRIEWPILSHSDPIQFSQVTPTKGATPVTPGRDSATPGSR